jgi:DNA-binding CsgD family transcriptional regulator
MVNADLAIVAAGITRFANTGLSPDDLRRSVALQLRRFVRFDAWSFALIDPANGMPIGFTGDNSAGIRRRQQRLFEIKYEQHEFSKVLRHTATGRVSVVGAATRENMAASMLRQDVLSPVGFGDALFAGIADRGTYWGHLSLYRAADRSNFTIDDVEIVHTLLSPIGPALRRAWISSPYVIGTLGEGPGTLLLDENLRILGATPYATRWVRDQVSDVSSDELPPVVYALAAWLKANVDQRPPQPTPRVRMRGSNGEWLVVSAARLDGPVRGTAITIELARPAEVLPMSVAAYGLSEREGRLVGLVLEGRSTAEIAKALFISQYTVQDHLKSVFGKVGVSSRRELAGRLLS